MKASMYFNYTSRSLVRGGQRTLLAIFCVAVGVMAIVALQLVGLMINNAFTSNVRDANGGDIEVRSQNQPFRQQDLSYFAQLKKDDKIIDYTPVINAQGTTSIKDSLRQSFSIRAVDPQRYPIVTPPTFVQPQNGEIASLLKDKQVVVTQPFIDQYKKKIGDTFEVRAGSRDQGARTITVKLAGIVSDTGVLAQAGSVVLIAQDDFQSGAPRQALLYDTINVTTASKARTDEVVKSLQDQFPIANVQTAEDALRTQQDLIDNIRKFLEISGLMALLIGGVGIVNTMQVLLSRRKTEIAMLKTTGYRRFDLYLLFGLETGLLGLVGGVIGAAAAIGVSYLVRNLVVQTFGLNIPFILDPFTIAGGVVIGVLTAFIFGLLPIVQAANIRPLNVIRDLPEGRGAGSLLLTGGLLLLLSVLFCALAIFILNNDVLLGISSVYGTFLFLAVLSIIFSLLILLLSRLPVPEKFNLKYIAGVVVGLLCAGLLYLYQPVFGLCLLVIGLLALVLMIFPRSWKVATKLALRNLGRERTRTTTTMLALCVGIFTIGLILVLGQNLRTEVNQALDNKLNYNLFSITSDKDTTTLQAKLSSVPGLSSYQKHTLAATAPVAINEKPVQQFLTGKNSADQGRNSSLYFLSGVEGYDVGNNQVPSNQFVKIVEGRNLNSEDAGKDNILIPNQLSNRDPFKLKLGDKITLGSIDRLGVKTVTVVGVYRTANVGGNLYPLLGTSDTTTALSPAGVKQSIFYMKVDPDQLNGAVDVIGNAVPNAFVLNIASITQFIDQLLNDILLTLTTIASLSLLAGIIIIANAVALAMLERRRELGILKSVGYTSRSILGEVLIENGIIGGIGSLLAMVLVAIATHLLSLYFFRTVRFSVGGDVTTLLIVGSIVLATLTATLVAWRSVRVRPLDVLRYE